MCQTFCVAPQGRLSVKGDCQSRIPTSLPPGTAVPSLTSFTYYAIFLFLLILWALQLRPRLLIRALRAFLVLYSGLHLLLLDLVQFSSLQERIVTEESSFVNETNTTVVTESTELAARYVWVCVCGCMRVFVWVWVDACMRTCICMCTCLCIYSCSFNYRQSLFTHITIA